MTKDLYKVNMNSCDLEENDLRIHEIIFLDFSMVASICFLNEQSLDIKIRRSLTVSLSGIAFAPGER